MGYFRRGDLVEVCSGEEGVLASYYATAVISEVRDNGYLVVQYKSLLTDDEALPPLTEMLPAKQVRPNPPEIPAKGFSFLDRVDAFDNDGWWVGKITGITDSGCYVYLDTIKEEIMYPLSQLRVHREWIDGEWISSNKKTNRDMPSWKRTDSFVDSLCSTLDSTLQVKSYRCIQVVLPWSS